MNDRPTLHDPDAATTAEQAVERLVADLQTGIDTKDAARYDASFAADVLWGSPYGRTLAGFEPLNAIHRSQLDDRRDGRPVVPTSRYETVQVLAPAPDVAVAHVRRRALSGDGFSEMAMYVLVERDGEWWLAGGQNTPIREMS